MQIAYRIKTNTGVGTAGAVLSLNGTTGEYHPVVFNVNSVISSRYGVNSTIILTYNSTASATAYLTENTKSTITGVWQAMDYDSNSDTKLRTYKQNGATDIDLPLLAGSIGTTTPSWTEPTAGSYKDVYGQVANDTTLTPKINLFTGDLKAKNFIENGVALSNKYLTSASLNNPIDLSAYNEGDVIPASIVTQLKSQYNYAKVLHGGKYYSIAQMATSPIDILVFIAISANNNDNAVQVLIVSKASGAADHTLSLSSVNVAKYDSNGLFTLKLDSNNKFVLQATNDTTVDIVKNSSQSGDIVLILPSTTGTLALASDIAGKVENVAYDTTNKKLTKTINGTTSDIVTVATLKTDLNLSKSDVGLGNVENKSSETIRGEITSSNVTTALGYTPYNSTNPSGYITGINAQMVETALGYVPYSAENPSGFISDYTVTQQDVTSALGYTPYNASNPAGYITGITGAMVDTALGYVPYDSTNPNGYITGISGSDVTTALGYTPYDSTNPNNYVTANVSTLNNYYTKTAVDGMVANRFQAKIVQTLPASGISTSTIYMVLQTGQTDIYDEYMYIENAWVKIGTTSIDMSDYAKTAELHNVALTGAYSSLVGKPTIPTNTSDLSNDSGFITNSVDNLTNYPKTTDLSAVAYSGSYNDLQNRPTVPTSVSQLTNDSGYLTNANLATTNISTFVNNVPYATLNDVRGLEDIDVEEIKKAIAAMEHIGTVTQVTGGTGLSGSGNTTVTINHSNSVPAVTAWPSGTSSPENGGQFKVRDIKYDTEGHATGYQDRTITLPLIPVYDDTTVRGLITDETTARQATDTRVTALENFNVNTFTSFVFCIFGIEPYIDPDTMQIVPDRYYQRSDVDTGIYMDNEKVDIHLKTWLKYHYNIDDLANLRNITCYVYAMGDHSEYVNHMVTFWSQRTNPSITSYPHLQQVGSFIDDGYGSVRRFTATQIGAILSSTDDGYVQADPLGTGKGFVTGWNTMSNRVTALEEAIGEINNKLDEINGEVI